MNEYNKNKRISDSFDNDDPFAKYDKLGDSFGQNLKSKKYDYDEESFSGEKKSGIFSWRSRDERDLYEDEKRCFSGHDDKKPSIAQYKNAVLKLVLKILKVGSVLLAVLFLTFSVADFSEIVSFPDGKEIVNVTIVFTYNGYDGNADGKYLYRAMAEDDQGNSYKDLVEFTSNERYNKGETARGYLGEGKRGSVFKDFENIEIGAFLALISVLVAACLTIKSWYGKFFTVIAVGIYSLCVSFMFGDAASMIVNMFVLIIFSLVMFSKKRKAKKQTKLMHRVLKV